NSLTSSEKVNVSGISTPPAEGLEDAVDIVNSGTVAAFTVSLVDFSVLWFANSNAATCIV
ncbi:hypothetical protein OFC62_43485, partial [Escherichia coli]|nr:hypothetical protein [Escherichia coli]